MKQDQITKSANIFVVKKHDKHYSDEGPSERDLETRWRYYIASYSSLEDTDGINKQNLSAVLLFRNLHAIGADPKSERFPPVALPSTDTVPEGQEGGTQATQPTSQDSGPEVGVGDRILARFLAVKNDERLVLRIAVNNYHPIFQPGTAEGFFEDLKQREGGVEGVKEVEECKHHREEVMKDSFLMNNPGMKGLSKEEVEKRNEEFAVLAGGDEKKAGIAQAEEEGADAEKMEVDG